MMIIMLRREIHNVNDAHGLLHAGMQAGALLRFYINAIQQCECFGSFICKMLQQFGNSIKVKSGF